MGIELFTWPGLVRFTSVYVIRSLLKYVVHFVYIVEIQYRVRVMVFSATLNNISVISWRSGLLVEKTGVPDLSKVTDKHIT
jgi:hypothetical protein